jgi:hypothetical protein
LVCCVGNIAAKKIGCQHENQQDGTSFWNQKKERAKCGTDGRIVTGTFCGRMNSCPSDMSVFLR